MSLSMAVALALAVFGGCWYPATYFPAALQAVARAEPAGWAMHGFLSVLDPRSPAGAALGDTAALLGCAALALVVALGLSRLRRTEFA